jgi:hypothetical protein
VKPLVIDAAGTALDRSGSPPNLRADRDLGASNSDPTCTSPFRAAYNFTAPKAGAYLLDIEYASGEASRGPSGQRRTIQIRDLEKPTLAGPEGFTNFGSYVVSSLYATRAWYPFGTVTPQKHGLEAVR